MIKKIETQKEIPASIFTKVQYSCDCGETFDQEHMAQAHYRERHLYTNSQSITELELEADCLRGDHVVHFATKEAFFAYLEGPRRGGKNPWEGPGWYVRYWVYVDCGRCSSAGCGHDEVRLVSVAQMARDLKEYICSAESRLAELKRLAGGDIGA